MGIYDIRKSQYKETMAYKNYGIEKSLQQVIQRYYEGFNNLMLRYGVALGLRLIVFIFSKDLYPKALIKRGWRSGGRGR